jgi:DNA-binding transcriptional LysR family regulator
MSTDRLAAMEIFVRVVDTGSFSAAATQLGVGQPAVSKTVAQLEERLGARLLVRSTRNLSLTDAGRSFYDNARRAIEGVNLAEQAVREEAGLEGTLRISASVCFSRLHLMPRLPEFLAEHRGLAINVLVDDRFVNLAEEGIDLALRTGTLTETSLNVRKIGESQRRVMATRGYWEAHGKPRSPEDLAAHELVVLERNGKPVDTWTFRKGALAKAVKLGGRVRVSSGEGMREAVLAGVGAAVVSEWLFSPELSTGAVRRVLEDWSLPVQDLWAVFPAGGLASAKARELVKFVERCLALGSGGAAARRAQA